MEKFSIKNKKGQTIVGIIEKPEGGGPFPAVLICPGLKGFKEQPQLKAIAEFLVKKGIVAVRFDGTNNVGESDGDVLDILGSHYIKDVECLIDYVLSLDYVSKVGLTGHSLGSMVSIFVAAEDNRISCIAAVASPYNPRRALEADYTKEQLEEWKKKGSIDRFSKSVNAHRKIGYQIYEESLTIDPYEAIKKIKVPILILTAEKDEIVEVKDARKAFEIANDPKEFVIMKGLPHTWLSKEDCEAVAEVVVNWFEKNL